MSLNAATIEILIAKGLGAADILEIARATEVKADPTNAARQARHRARKRNAVTVTEAPPYEEDTSTPCDVLEDGEASPHSSRAPAQPVSAAKDVWNEAAVAAGWPTVSALNSTRTRNLSGRLREHGLEGWKAALKRAQSSPYLGRDPPSWFTFDWLAKAGNFLKLIEGNYDRRIDGNQGSNGRMGGPRPDPTLAIVRAATAAQRTDGGDYREARPSLPPGQYG